MKQPQKRIKRYTPVRKNNKQRLEEFEQRKALEEMYKKASTDADELKNNNQQISTL